ncbi:MAG: hypothetical protein IPJ71_15430 [Bdellovibrionales bacterium]|nr:hypothetical protein [Bdellovibrionales bacterium]
MVEQLARYTFIVMAIEHFGEGLSTHFPGGSPLNLDRRIDWSEMNAKLEKPQLSVEEIKQKCLCLNDFFELPTMNRVEP